MEINIKTIKSRGTSLSSLPCAMIAPPTCFPASHTELSSSQTWPLRGRKSLKSLIRAGVLLDLHHCNLSRNGCAYFVPALCLSTISGSMQVVFLCIFYMHLKEYVLKSFFFCTSKFEVSKLLPSVLIINKDETFMKYR